LTVVKEEHGELTFDLGRETLQLTCLGQLKPHDHVNVERAMQLGSRIGGHLVSGHIDGVGQVVTINANPDGWLIKIEVPKKLGKYLIKKGSVVLNGVSLTVNEVEDHDQGSQFSVMLIPQTLQVTNLKHLTKGDHVNIETDMIAKFIERLIATRS